MPSVMSDVSSPYRVIIDMGQCSWNKNDDRLGPSHKSMKNMICEPSSLYLTWSGESRLLYELNEGQKFVLIARTKQDIEIVIANRSRM
jgi:hypothetical protein